MSEKLRAEWFWSDRWRSSSAFCLTIEERGLYREMLTASWSLGGWLPAEHETIRRYIGCSKEEWDRCWPAVKQYWKQNEAKLYNETQREILMDALTLSEKRALAGRRGGQASGKARSKRPARGEATPEANPKQTNPPSPSPSLSPTNGVSHPTDAHPDGKPPGHAKYPDHFERFWKVYPVKMGKHVALSSWRRHVPAGLRDQVVAAVERHAASSPRWLEGVIPNPATWLNQHRWEDELEPERASSKDIMARARELREARRVK